MILHSITRHWSAVRMGVLAGIFSLAVQNEVQAAAYQDAVMALNPSFYYQLNETSTAGGVIDSTGHAVPGSYNGDYVNGPAMVGGEGPLEVFGGLPVPGVGGAANKAHYSNNQGHILLGPGENYGSNAITVALFLKAGGAEGGDRVFTNNLTDPTKSFQIVTANDGLVLAVDPATTGVTAERTLFMEDNSGPDRRLIDSGAGWFHIVASTQGATGPDRANNFRIWVNGVERTSNLQPNATGWGVDTTFAKIGGRRETPTDSTTHSGAQDEVAIWKDRVLTPAEVMSLWDAARGLPNYAKTVISLSPTFYYQLDETTTNFGCKDTMGRAALPGAYNGDYFAGPAMVGGPGALEVLGGTAVPGLGGEKNFAHYSNNAGHIDLGPGTDYGAKAMTVALFFKAGGSQGGDRIFTNNLTDATVSFQIVTADQGLVLAVDPNSQGAPAERTLFLEDNSGPDLRLSNAGSGWFHVIASTHGETGPDRAGNFKLWINGVDRTENLQPNSTGWGVDTFFAKIGGRRENPTDTTTHPGAQDEVAIWLNRVLTDAEARLLWTAATTTTGPPGIRSITLRSLRRNINGTPEILTDDTVDFTIVVAGTGSPDGWLVSGPVGSSLVGQGDDYGSAHAFTAVPIAEFPGGALTLTVRDGEKAELTANIVIEVPVTVVDWRHTWDYMNPMGLLPDKPGAAGGPDEDFNTTWFLKAADFTAQYDGPTFGGAAKTGDPNIANSYDAGSGPGPLGYEPMDYWNTAGAQFTSYGTLLTIPVSGSRYSSYFRTTFTVPNDGRTWSKPVINYLMDDGGYIYLDGELILDVNMVPGSADAYEATAANATDTENQLRSADLTLAAGSATGGLATSGAKNAILVKTVSSLTPGVHTLAASLHNATNASSDHGFSLQLTSVVTGGGTGSEDTDGDGVSNAVEAIMGTDPNNNTDVLRLTRNPATSSQIQFLSKAGKFYRVYSSTDLNTWTGSGTTIAGDGSVKSFDVVTTGGTRRYYRLHVMGTDGPWAP